MTKEAIKPFAIVAVIVACVIAFCAHYMHSDDKNVEKRGERTVEVRVDDKGNPQPNLVGEDLHTGYVPNPEETEKYLKELGDKAEIRDAAPALFNNENKPTPDPEGTMLYRPFRKAYESKYKKEWHTIKQGIGDCTSMAGHHAIGIALAVEYSLGNASDWDLPSTESLYGGARVEGSGLPGDGKRPVGGYSDGSYGAAIVKFATNYGMLMRRKYDFADLREYSSKTATLFGAYGNGGPNDIGGKADKLCRDYPLKQATRVKTYAEAKAAIDNGYPIICCSTIGFEAPQDGKGHMLRDKDGYCHPNGKWPHAMCMVATRKDKKGIMILNSWGDYLRGPKFPEDMPESAFWASEKAVNMILSQGDSFAVSACGGFEPRKLDNSEWVQLAPPAEHASDNSPIFALAP